MNDVARRNLAEIVTEEEFEGLLERGSFNFYWGIAPTGPVHIGYLVPFMKLMDLIECGGKATVLIADYHAYLDDRKTPWEEMEVRSEYVEVCLRKILKEEYREKVKFVRGSGFQTSEDYVRDTLKLSGMVSVKRAMRAASEVVRFGESPKVSGLIYPIMQNVDVKYLEADVALGGIDQRHIYMLGREILEEVGWKRPVCLFTPLITSLRGPEEKMSASKPETCVIVHESEESIRKKILKAWCPARESRENPVLEIAKYFIFPYFGKVEVEGKVYESYGELEKAFVEGMHPLELKNAVANYLIKFTEPVRKYFEVNESFLEDVRKSMEKSEYFF